MFTDPYRFAPSLLPQLDWSSPDVGRAIHLIIGHVYAFDKEAIRDDDAGRAGGDAALRHGL